MEYKIQSIVFPTETKHQLCKELFFKGGNYYLETDTSTIHLPKFTTIDFTTYLNSCSYRKWKKYTKVNNLKAYIDIQGKFTVSYIGYSKNIATIERVEFAKIQYNLEKREIVCFEYPENNEQLVGFEISTQSECSFYGGYYTTTCEQNDLRRVRLAIATTTCKKEDFIKKNISILRNEILENQNVEQANQIYIHVVDNGMSLNEDEIFGKNVFLHPNHNTGGSGGFARGMIEALHQPEKATHVLLMDDDILILPESILRTYNLLNLLKEQYKDSFISGAMLYYEEPFRQHEDIGTVTKDCMFFSLKPKFDHRVLNDNLENENDFVKQKNEYAGWWYCCIPTEVIEREGLPLPMFIRCDDMEYSLRCKANIITMNGICVWHMGFSTKYNAAFDKYQQCRNLLIDQSCSDILGNVNVFDFIKKSYRIELLKFNYNAAELVIRALEDYLKGPDFLKIDQGEKIVKENAKLNDKLVPLDEIDGVDILNVFSCYEDQPRKFIDKWIYRITFNGQRFWPSCFCKSEYAYIGFDHSYQPQKMCLHKNLVAINPFNKTGIVRELDKKTYRKLQRRFRNAVHVYKNNREQLIKTYRETRQYLTSETFWRKYLNI